METSIRVSGSRTEHMAMEDIATSMAALMKALGRWMKNADLESKVGQTVLVMKVSSIMDTSMARDIINRGLESVTRASFSVTAWMVRASICSQTGASIPASGRVDI